MRLVAMVIWFARTRARTSWAARVQVAGVNGIENAGGSWRWSVAARKLKLQVCVTCRRLVVSSFRLCLMGGPRAISARRKGSSNSHRNRQRKSSPRCCVHTFASAARPARASDADCTSTPPPNGVGRRQEVSLSFPLCTSTTCPCSARARAISCRTFAREFPSSRSRALPLGPRSFAGALSLAAAARARAASVEMVRALATCCAARA